jgi:hypothetical protein
MYSFKNESVPVGEVFLDLQQHTVSQAGSLCTVVWRFQISRHKHSNVFPPRSSQGSESLHGVVSLLVGMANVHNFGLFHMEGHAPFAGPLT